MCRICSAKLISFFSWAYSYFPAFPCSWTESCDWVLANGTWADVIGTTPRPARCKPLTHTPHAFSLPTSQMSSQRANVWPQVKDGRFALQSGTPTILLSTGILGFVRQLGLYLLIWFIYFFSSLIIKASHCPMPPRHYLDMVAHQRAQTCPSHL